MRIIILIIIMWVVFNIHKLNKTCKPKKKVRFDLEGFNMAMSDDQEPEFNPNSRNNDYDYDRNGRKGILFNQGKYKATAPIEKENLKFDYDDVVHKLELYPEKFYNKCTSEFDPDELQDEIINNDPSNTYLGFNQGVIYNQITANRES